MAYGLPSLQRVASLSAFLWPTQVTASKNKSEWKRRKSKQVKFLTNAFNAFSHKQVCMLLSKLPSRISKFHSWMPSQNQLEASQCGEGEEVANDKGKWTVG